jgi:hypothetical protein
MAGPTVVPGPLVAIGNQSPIQNRDYESGPSAFNDGTAVVDDRFVIAQGAFPNRFYALNASDFICTVDGFPTASATNNIVNAQGAGGAAGTSLTLATGTVQSAVSNVPIAPWTLTTDVYGNRYFTPPQILASNVVTAGLTLDFGMCAGTTFTSSTVTLSTTTGPGYGVVPNQYAGQTVNKNQIVQLQTTNHVQPETMFVPGQYIIVANAGNAGGTAPLIAQILAIDYANHYLYINAAAQSAVTNGGIGNANPYGPAVGIAYWPYQVDGATLLFDPRQGISRVLSYVSSNAGDTTVTVTVSGWDVYGIPMTETITLNGTTAVAGKKAFKAIKSAVTGAASLVGNVSIGTQATSNGVVGLNIRTDTFSYLNVAVADAQVGANTGFTKADLTWPTTATTGDVRGTYALQAAANGTTRVYIAVNPSQYNWSQATNLTPHLVFGNTQF